MKIAKIGDLVTFKFSDSPDYAKVFRGKEFGGKVGIVDQENKTYGVWTEYGQDYIDFDAVTKIEKGIV